VVHVAPSRRLRQRQVEDGRVDATDCVRPCYPTFVIFNVLGPRGIVVIYPFAWAYIYDPRVDGAPCHFPISFHIS
jgi:hypothetical protein